MKIYVASKTKHASTWRQFRAAGWPIISTWIDEAEEGETASFSELWQRINNEVLKSDILIFYCDKKDTPLKGAYIEVGMALAYNHKILVYTPDIEIEVRNGRPIGSWVSHPNVMIMNSFKEIREYIMRGYLKNERRRDQQGD